MTQDERNEMAEMITTATKREVASLFSDFKQALDGNSTKLDKVLGILSIDTVTGRNGLVKEHDILWNEYQTQIQDKTTLRNMIEFYKGMKFVSTMLGISNVVEGIALGVLLFQHFVK